MPLLAHKIIETSPLTHSSRHPITLQQQQQQWDTQQLQLSTTMHISTLTTCLHYCTYRHLPPSFQPPSKRLLRLILAANAHAPQLENAPHPSPLSKPDCTVSIIGMTAIAALTVDTCPRMTSLLLNALLQITTLYPAH